MKIARRMNRGVNKFRMRSKYSYYRADKSFYKTQFKNLLISIIIVSIILIMKMIDTEPTQKAIKIVNNVVNSSFNIEEDGKKIIEYVNNITKAPEKVISVFKYDEK